MTMVGTPAPSFRMASTKNLDLLNDDVSLDDYAGRWLVMFFYPADFTFVCPTEVLAFSERAAEFEAAGASLLGVSVDNVHSHQAWIEFVLGKLAFPLASDLTKQVSRTYGILDEDEGLALRGLFIIDPSGVIQYEVVHGLNTGRSVDEIIRVLHACQVEGRTPANWKIGDQPLAA
jgi:peroxiredoxin (alkyl hydroperoxide reductase subunit C)